MYMWCVEGHREWTLHWCMGIFGRHSPFVYNVWPRLNGRLIILNYSLILDVWCSSSSFGSPHLWKVWLPHIYGNLKKPTHPIPTVTTLHIALSICELTLFHHFFELLRFVMVLLGMRMVVDIWQWHQFYTLYNLVKTNREHFECKCSQSADCRLLKHIKG